MQMLFAAMFLITTLSTAQAAASQAHEYIRIVQENGVWWFQDGAGHRFFSLGVNCVGGCYGHAEATPMLPARQQWIVALLRGWNFNTAASWSSPSVWPDLYVADQIYLGLHPAQHDVFDASLWHGQYAARLRSEVAPFLGRKNFIGYFLDNEPAWKAQDIFAFYLSLAKDRPGSRAFAAYLRTYYQGRLRKLNREWGTAYTSFDQLPGAPPPKQYAAAMQQGIIPAWKLEVVTTYYRQYTALVRALDPDHLILGIRYRGVPELELFKALSPYFDVNSINDYNRYGHLKPVYAELYQATGKPLMITEFSFSGFPHPGYASALFIDVYTQENRGRGYHKYVLQAARAPFMLGMHWFMWMDYAPHDRSIGGHPPDENVGLVSNNETAVYEELGKWITRTNAAVEATHRTARWVPPAAPAPPHRVLKRFIPTLDGDVSEWPHALAIKPALIDALADDIRVDHTYFLSWDEQYLYLAGDISDARLEHPSQDWAWEGDYLSIALSSESRRNRRAGPASTLSIYPIGAGPDRRQPHAIRWHGPRGYQPIAVRVEKRLKPGGYTIEARIPTTAVWGFKGVPGALWNIQLRYQNVHEISRTHWEGVVTLRP
jgi:hypothetical protein